MRIIIMLFAALALHGAMPEPTPFFSINTCDDRVMVKCVGTSHGKRSTLSFWAKYPKYPYNAQADIGSEWLCKTSSNGRFTRNVSQLKFKIPETGLTILVKNGRIFKKVPGIEKNCPLSSY